MAEIVADFLERQVVVEQMLRGSVAQRTRASARSTSATPTESRAMPHSSSQSKKRSMVLQHVRIVSLDHPRSFSIHVPNTATSSAWACRAAGQASSSRPTKRSHCTAWPTNDLRTSGRTGRLDRRSAAASIRHMLTGSASRNPRR